MTIKHAFWLLVALDVLILLAGLCCMARVHG